MGTLQFFDPPNIIQSAASLMALRDQIEGRRDQRAERERIATARLLTGLAMGGDPNAMAKLQQVDPASAMGLEEYQRNKQAQELAIEQSRQVNPLLREQQVQQNMLDEQKIAAGEQAAEAKGFLETRRRIQEGARMFDVISKDPSEWPRIRQEAMDAGVLPKNTPEEFPTKEAMKEFGAHLKIMARATRDPKTFKAASSFGENIQDSLAIGAIDQKTAQDLMRRYNEALLADESAKAGAHGGHGGATGPLTPGATTDVQKDYSKAEVLSDSARALTEFLPQIRKYVGARGKAAKAAGSIADYFGLVGTGQEKGKSTFLDAGSLERETNNVVDQIRIITTGAAAPEAELKRIESKLNVGMGAAEYTRALEDLLGILDRAQNTRRRVLATGVQEGSDEFKRQVNEDWYKPKDSGQKASTAAPSGSPEERQAFGDKLFSEGKTKEQVIEEMRKKFGGG